MVYTRIWRYMEVYEGMWKYMGICWSIWGYMGVRRVRYTCVCVVSRKYALRLRVRANSQSDVLEVFGNIALNSCAGTCVGVDVCWILAIHREVFSGILLESKQYKTS